MLDFCPSHYSENGRNETAKCRWERLWRTALAALDEQGKLDWSMAFLDGSFAPAKAGAEKVGVTKKGKRTKWMVVVDGNGLPLGFHLDRANAAEVRLAEQTLDTISVSRARGRPKRRPAKLVADRGYDRSAFRCALRGPGHQDVHPAQATPRKLESEAGPSYRRAQRGLSIEVHGGAQLRLAGRLSATAHPLPSASSWSIAASSPSRCSWSASSD
jgi:hypothetical protein